MLKIECYDTKKGFSMSVELEGTAYKIAQELNTALEDINKKCPQVIDMLLYIRELNFENPPLND